MTTTTDTPAEALPPLPDVQLAEIRNDNVGETVLSETGTAYYGSNWVEVRKLYTAEQMHAYARAALEARPDSTTPVAEPKAAGSSAKLAQAEAKPAPAEPVAWYVIRVAPGKRDDGRRVGLWWKREQAEEWVDEHHVLRPLVDAAPAEPAPANIRERWNIERDGDDLLVCFNNHDKGEKCEYERFVRAPAAPALEPSPYCLWPSRGSCRAWQDKQAEAKPLTPEQIDAIAGPGPDYFDRTAFARAIERAHGIGAASKGEPA